MSTIKADNIATLAGVSTSMANAVNGSAKAWVNFTNAMADANYALSGSASAGMDEWPTTLHIREDAGGLTSSSARTLVDGGTSGFPSWDSLIVCVIIFS